MERRAPEPSRGRGGKGARKKKPCLVARVWGRGCTIRGWMRPSANEPRQSVFPKALGRRRIPSGASPQRPRAACLPRSSPAYAYTCALRAELENFPRTPAARSPPIRPSVAALRDCPSPLVSLLLCGKKSAEPGRPDRLIGGRRTSPNCAGGIGEEDSHATPAGAPRDRPGPGLCARLGGRRSAASWAPGSSPTAAGSSPLPRLWVGSPPPSGKGAIDPSVHGPGSPACFSHGIYSKRSEAPKRKRLAGIGLKER